ncbi:MAG: GNAT family N-acetyltransferase [Bacteroidia bacterium]|jgi:RimJ/RimL family protein N-acetyltransferase
MKGKLTHLVSLSIEHLPIVSKWNFDPEVNEFFSGRFPNNSQEQEIWLQNQLNKADKKKLIIIENSTNSAIGMIGIMKIDHLNKNCEIGITIGEKTFWGKNHSHDALHVCINFLFHQLQMHCVYATVLSSNHRALKFFAKNNFENNGFLRDAIFRNGKFENLQFLSLINTDYK